MANRIFTVLAFSILAASLPLAGQEQPGEGERLGRLAAEDLAAGRLPSALEKYERAALHTGGAAGQSYRLRILQIKLELGEYEGLAAAADPLVGEGGNPAVRRAALIVKIKSLAKTDRGTEALELMVRYGEELVLDPSSALGLSDAYRDLGRIDEARRIEWIIKRDYPQSPEGLILTGRAERRPKPSLLLP